MRKFFEALFGLVMGYVAGGLIGAGLVELFSGNTHDKSVEAAMTAAFVAGPLGAVIGLLAALLRRRRSGAKK